MATKNLTLYPQYGTGNGWNNSTSADSNRYYIGGSSAYRARMYFTVPNDAEIGAVSQLVIRILGDSAVTPGYMRAFLSTSNVTTGDMDDVASHASSIIATSRVYSNPQKSARPSAWSATGNNLYFVFNVALTRGATYYVYIAPYSTDYAESATNIGDTSYSGTWLRSQNNATYTSGYVTYSPLTYTVAYNANGGTGAPGSQTKTHGTALTLSSTKPTRANSVSTFVLTGNGNGGIGKTATATKTIRYTFAGWATSASGAAAYQPGGSYTANANVTLYAVWTSVTEYSNNTIADLGTTTRDSDSAGTYRVTLDACGGVCSAAYLDAARTTSYAFLGWDASAGATSNLAADKAYTSAVTVYARWSGTTTTQAVELPVPTKVGYDFAGWATSPDASTGITGNYTPPGNVTLYAVWKTEGAVQIYDGTQWQRAAAYIFDGTQWKQGILWCYDGTRWQRSGN